ncbi:hypothetical protein EXIGLDRAFT_759293 [Exidia glandulosa HHB12029]|uniref:Uncharacterized protein n=1 Tax=Exidia glandulosa HHB12029 TaxID=1314781 RepID=A0A165Q281_EXIGL|nr:hypothetical protein EXIGLDRAFT_759293 [Exidia glandulosa HHB12029]
MESQTIPDRLTSVQSRVNALIRSSSTPSRSSSARHSSRLELLRRATALRRTVSDGRQSRLGHRRSDTDPYPTPAQHRRCSSYIDSVVAEEELVERRAGATSRLAHVVDDPEELEDTAISCAALRKTLRRVSGVEDFHLNGDDAGSN